ncbi:MAG: GTPase [Flavobacteriales bacterium]|nr:GTPase [Flavobacteriales bacterium]
MVQTGDRGIRELIFIYNADSGFFDRLADIALKAFSPSTYPCTLCKVTHGVAGMHGTWKSFLAELPVEKKFLYKDEVRAAGISYEGEFPVILGRDHHDEVHVVVSSDTLNNITSMNDLTERIRQAL